MVEKNCGARKKYFSQFLHSLSKLCVLLQKFCVGGPNSVFIITINTNNTIDINNLINNITINKAE